MSFRLSERSMSKLRGVHPDLVKVVTTAITLTDVDFGCICGLRTEEEQKELVAKGASKTMNSFHRKQVDGFSHAVDLMAYVGSRASWEETLYDNIADSIKAAAEQHGVGVTWGGAWQADPDVRWLDIRDWAGTMEAASLAYIDLRRSQGKRPFYDGPHFELTR
tara:strand:- start:31 stop:519 length:489 start_codon:yes stop_codon:yes gene_type:complete